MNIYVIKNKLGNIQFIYGSYSKACSLNCCPPVRKLNCNEDDVRYGRVRFESLPYAMNF